MPDTNQTRIEHDLLGDVNVPSQALWGAQTQRALANFPPQGQRTVGDFPTLVQGLIRIKQAAAFANRDIGKLADDIANAIIMAGESVLKERRYDLFPVHYLHGGGGTSANMNANEVLANIGEELLGGKRGAYSRIHPNDHVNLNQSTNDVYPAACHMAIILQWPDLKHGMDMLAKAISTKAAELAPVMRIARTCLQDAVAISFADLFGGYSSFVKRSIERTETAVNALYAVPLGGTIVGRASDVPTAYMDAIIPALIKSAKNDRYRQSKNLFDAAQNMDDIVQVSAALDITARGIVKISKDLRLMNSGPETGFCEISLPAVQPGSSIMPGKVNPVIPEFAVQLAFKVMGNHTGCLAAMDHGELDLNVWESIATFNILESMELMQNCCATLATKCIKGLSVNLSRNNDNAGTIIPLLTELMKQHGYSKVSKICAVAQGNLTRLRKLLREKFP